MILEQNNHSLIVFSVMDAIISSNNMFLHLNNTLGSESSNRLLHANSMAGVHFNSTESDKSKQTKHWSC